MGWWNSAVNGDSLQENSTGLVWGDGPADILATIFWPDYGQGWDSSEFHQRLGLGLKSIVREFELAFNRLPTKQEIIAGILFQLKEVRELLEDLPDGPAPYPQQSAPGMLNVGPISDVEWDFMSRLLKDEE